VSQSNPKARPMHWPVTVNRRSCGARPADISRL
jgi:hypothetical protein